MGIIVKLLSKGLGMTSEAIHQARAGGQNQYGQYGDSPSSSSSPYSAPRGPPPEYVEVADEATAAEWVRSGRAERVVDYNDEKKRMPPAGYADDRGLRSPAYYGGDDRSLRSPARNAVDDRNPRSPAYYGGDDGSLRSPAYNAGDDRSPRSPAYYGGGDDRSLRPVAYGGEERSRSRSRQRSGRSNNGSDDSSYDSDADTDIGDDEAVWQLDDLAEEMEPPSYRQYEANAAREAESLAGQSEEVKAGREEQMVRELLQMVGPPPRSRVPRLPCPVVIPQRRPRATDRGFVRAYAPVLAPTGIDQNTFIKFINDLDRASKSSRWLDVVFMSAGIAGMAPSAAAQITSIVIQVVAGTAREVQSRGRRNTYLDMVNEEVFKPRGMYAMIMAFKDEIPGQSQRGPLSRVAGLTGQALFSTEHMSIEETAARRSAPNPNASSLSRTMDKLRLQSGKTYTALELPRAAELVYPSLDNAVRQELDGKGKQNGGFKDKVTGGMSWVADYLDRREQAFYEADHPGSVLVASDPQRRLVSRFNDPNHPANSGSLIALLTGGYVDPKGRRSERRERKDEKDSRKYSRRDERDDRRDARRIARGKSPKRHRSRERREAKMQREMQGQPRRRDGRRQQQQQPRGIIHKLMQKDVLYLVVTNLPSQEEVRQDVAQLENMLAPGRY